METPALTIEKAVALAEQALATLREVKDLVERPPVLTDEMRDRGLSPNRIAAAHLAAAAAALGEAVRLPERHEGTSISRESVSMTLTAPIALLERFLVRARHEATRGRTKAPDDAEKTLFYVGAVISTLLAAKATFPLPDPAAEAEGGAADADTFRHP